MYLNLNNLYKQIVCTNYLYLNTPSNTYNGVLILKAKLKAQNTIRK